MGEVMEMLTNQEINKIIIAFRKNLSMLWSFIMIIPPFIFLFTYIIFDSYNTERGMGIIAGGLFVVILCGFSMYRFFSEMFPSKKLLLHSEGLVLPISRKISKNGIHIIKYEWIEMVILNEMGGGSLYFDIFFIKNDEKYIYRDFQSKIENIAEFVYELRKRGVEVKILEPSFTHQKKYDFDLISQLMRGRKWI